MESPEPLRRRRKRPTLRAVRDDSGWTSGDVPPLIRGLRAAAAYPHPAGHIRLVQTHISWVLLTGAYAYKIKKPVDLGFVDFSTLEKRRRACAGELRLNARWAPELYVDVVPITGTAAAPRVGGAGPAFEYAVRMRQFPPGDQLDRRLAAGVLSPGELEDFARRLAASHQAAPAASPDAPFGSVAAVRRPVDETVAHLLALSHDAEAVALMPLREWLATHPADARLRARRAGGCIRELHGDLHLANLVRWRGVIIPFDRIEFDPALRWIDVLSDAAFLVMDLAFHGRNDLAYLFLNAYLEATGDYAGLDVLRYYVVYRALVRAKIAAIRRGDAAAPGAGAHGTRVQRYVALARCWAMPAPPLLVLMNGVAGSGKTRLAAALLGALPAVRLRSDVERKRLRGLPTLARTGAPVGTGLYGPAATRATYARLARLAAAGLRAGENVVVDAAFLTRSERARFLRLARRLGVPCVIVACRAPVGVLEQRIRARAAAGGDASEADGSVLAHQLTHAEALTPVELATAVQFETLAPVEPGAAVRAIRDAAAPALSGTGIRQRVPARP